LSNEETKRILFDVGHGEKLDITSDEFKDFKEFLKKNNYEIWQLNQTPVNLEMLEDYSIFFIGSPKNTRFDEDEVTEILKFLRDGGALIIVNSAGGDQHNNTNLNSISNHLGHQFNGDFLAHESDFENDDFYQVVCRGISMDPLTMGVRSVYVGSACTINITDPSGAKSLVFSHEPWPESRHVAVNGYYSLGRYVATSVELFKYVKRHDNSFLLQSLLYWLCELRGENEFI
jgi:hypothetical protein